MDVKNTKKEPETPLWKVDVPLNILVFSFIVSPVPLLLWGIDLVEVFQNDEFIVKAIPFLLFGLYLSQFIPFTFLSLHRRKLFLNAVRSS